MATSDPIVAPAIRLPGGHIVTGVKNHADAASAALKAGHKKEHIMHALLFDPHSTGFVSKTGKYYSRPQAVEIVAQHKQFHPEIADKVRHKLITRGAAGDPSTPLDSGDIVFAKSQASFEEIEHTKKDGVRSLVLRVMHPNGQQGMDVHMMRGDGHPKGWWDIANVDPVDKTQKIEGHTHSNAFANRLGPAVVRQTVKHLKQNYGVTKLRGHRVSGARFAGQPDDKTSIEQRDLKYTEKQIEKSYRFETTANGSEDGYHEIEVRGTHEPTGTSVSALIGRFHKDPEGLWNVVTVSRDKPQGDWRSHKNAGAFGVTGVRAMANYLRDTHGVHRLSGARITGTRRTSDDNYTEVALKKADVENSFKRRSRGDALQPWKIVKRKPKHPLFDDIMIVRIPRGAERDQYNAPTSTPGYAEAMADAAGDSGNV